VFAELHWTPGMLVQCEDRAHRIGQKNSVNIHYLCAPGTSDDMMWPIVERKVQIVTQMCDGRKGHMDAQASGRFGETPQEEENVTTVPLDAAEKEFPSDDDLDFEDLVAAAALDDAAPEMASPKAKTQTDGNGVNISDVSTSQKPASKVAATEASPKRSAFSVISMLQNGKPARVSMGSERWNCENCSCTNGGPRMSCRSCGRARQPVPCDKEDDVEEDLASYPYTFSVSTVTGRIHLHDEDHHPVGLNFKLADLEVGGTKTLPKGFEDPIVMAATRSFVAAWTALRPTEQRQLVGQPLKPPLASYLRKPVGSTKREGAKKKPTGVCGWCSRALHASAVASNVLFCSSTCQEKAVVQSDQAAARVQLFAIERGVCKICGLDAHELFRRVAALEPPMRYQELMQANFALPKKFEKLLTDPREGMFWQADHIVPVAEGGGEADLANFRTLCTMCHVKETRKLEIRIRGKARAKGTKDIRMFMDNKTEVSELDAAEPLRDNADEEPRTAPHTAVEAPALEASTGPANGGDSGGGDDLSDDILFGDVRAPRAAAPEVLDLLTQASDPTPHPKPKRRRILETPPSPCQPPDRATEPPGDASPEKPPQDAKASKTKPGKPKGKAKPVLRKIGKKT